MGNVAATRCVVGDSNIAGILGEVRNELLGPKAPAAVLRGIPSASRPSASAAPMVDGLLA